MDVAHGEIDENDPLAPRFGDKRATFVASSRTKMNPVRGGRIHGERAMETHVRFRNGFEPRRTKRLTPSFHRSQEHSSASIERWCEW